MLEAVNSKRVITGIAVLGGSLALSSASLGKSNHPNDKPAMYRVSGTCANGSCTVNERRAPTVHSRRVGLLHEGQLIDIICQERGGEVTAPNGVHGTMWDKIEAPEHTAFISDLFVDTPGVNHFSPGIRHCE